MIVIGATPDGIGSAYGLAKSLGFKTLGIVSSKSLVYGGQYSPDADQVLVVKDHLWGGYDLENAGQLSATTEVFLAASKSISAYGGGEITAFTISEAQRRGLPVTFTEFSDARGSSSAASSIWETFS